MMVRHVCNYTPSLLHSFPSQKSKQMVDANTLAFLSLSLSFFLFFFFWQDIRVFILVLTRSVHPLPGNGDRSKNIAHSQVSNPFTAYSIVNLVLIPIIIMGFGW